MKLSSFWSGVLNGTVGTLLLIAIFQFLPSRKEYFPGQHFPLEWVNYDQVEFAQMKALEKHVVRNRLEGLKRNYRDYLKASGEPSSMAEIEQVISDRTPDILNTLSPY